MLSTTEAALKSLKETRSLMTVDAHTDSRRYEETFIRHCGVLGTYGFSTNSASLFTALNKEDAAGLGNYSDELMKGASHPPPRPPYRNDFDSYGPCCIRCFAGCVEKINRVHASKGGESVFSTLAEVVRIGVENKDKCKYDGTKNIHSRWMPVVCNMPAGLHMLNIMRVFDAGKAAEIVSMAIAGHEDAKLVLTLPGYIECPSDWEVFTRHKLLWHLFNKLYDKLQMWHAPSDSWRVWCETVPERSRWLDTLNHRTMAI